MVFYIYNLVDTKRLGTVYAKNANEAKAMAIQKWGMLYDNVIACTVPLPEKGGLVIW
jgi:hypothetical protein